VVIRAPSALPRNFEFFLGGGGGGVGSILPKAACIRYIRTSRVGEVETRPDVESLRTSANRELSLSRCM
jgi:hypothetical protein